VDVDGGGIDLDTQSQDDPPGEPGSPTPDAAMTTRSRDWRWAVAGFGRTLIALGILVLLFVVYQLWGTGIQEARSQNQLENQFNDIIATAPAPTTTPTTVSTVAPSVSVAPTVPTTTLPLSAKPPGQVKEGDPLARIEIPKIGVDKIVVAGVALSDLRKGPGLYPFSALPGQIGNAAIAGHRTTYGAPFFRVDELTAGDEIIVTTVQGKFRYLVTEIKIVKPTDFSVLDQTKDATLTLTSCNPRYSSRQRIVVKAKLDVSQSPEPLPAAATTAPSSVTTAPTLAGGDEGSSDDASADETSAEQASADSPLVSGVGDSFSAGWFSDSSAWLPTILWGLGAALVVFGFWMLGRRWNRWAAYALAVLPFLFFLYFFYENVARLLPPNI
jgi:sortase A